MINRNGFKLVDVPEGKSGDWEVARFETDPFHLAIHNLTQPLRRMEPGTYTRLTHRGDVVMSDTPAELRDLYPLCRHLKGQMLFHGLGLGVAIQGALDQSAVSHVTVVEISQCVIALVGEHYLRRYGDRLRIINADAFTWQPPKGIRYDAVWHDIWPTICGDHWPEMNTLHRRYGCRCEWQGAWCRSETKRAAR